MGNCKISSPSTVVNRVYYLVLLDVTSLLSQEMHVKSRKEWESLVGIVRCGNKYVSP
jgi:hypothetical protein